MKKSSKPEWAGRLPFTPDKKRPFHFGKSDGMPRVFGKPGHKVTTRTFLSTDKLSCSSFMVPAGGYFEPFDIHGGDEVYYLACGTGTVLNPLTGRALSLQAGDFMLIPKDVWHQFYNFGEEIASVVTCFAPRMWSEMGTAVKFPGKALFYKSGSKPPAGFPRASEKRAEYLRPADLASIGCFPVGGAWARTTQEMFVIPRGQALEVIHGKENRTKVSFYVSNDFVHAGTYTIAGNRQTEVESHQGDKLIYVTKGTISVVVMADKFNPESVSVPRFEVQEEERLFIPENTSHYFFNLGPGNAEIVFFVAPEL